jgi:hypothetical protein
VLGFQVGCLILKPEPRNSTKAGERKALPESLYVAFPLPALEHRPHWLALGGAALNWFTTQQTQALGPQIVRLEGKSATGSAIPAAHQPGGGQPH